MTSSTKTFSLFSNLENSSALPPAALENIEEESCNSKSGVPEKVSFFSSFSFNQIGIHISLFGISILIILKLYSMWINKLLMSFEKSLSWYYYVYVLNGNTITKTCSKSWSIYDDFEIAHCRWIWTEEIAN